MQALIVEDSRLARNELKELLKEHSHIVVVAEAANIEQAKLAVESHLIDVIFLDINLPDGTGFDFLESLQLVPFIIFTTAYDEYAMNAFEYNALDYLLKPINEKKLQRSIGRLQESLSSKKSNQRTSVERQIFVKENEHCWLIEVKDIRYFESCGNHTRIYFSEHKPFIYKSLNKISERLPGQFFRASRQYIINLNAIASVEAMDSGGLLLYMNDGKEIEVSRRNALGFKRRLSL